MEGGAGERLTRVSARGIGGGHVISDSPRPILMMWEMLSKGHAMGWCQSNAVRSFLRIRNISIHILASSASFAAELSMVHW